MSSFKLTPEHPLYKKHEKISEILRDLNVVIYWDGYHMKIKDTQTGVDAYIRDADSSEETSEFPYHFETKLVIEK